jgi:general secretion pathway protein D
MKIYKNTACRLALLSALLFSIPSSYAAEFSAAFKNTDIQEFINTVSKNLGKTIIIDPSVKGKISVRSYDTLNDEQYYQFFLSVLDVYGYSAIEMPNGILKVIPAKGAKNAAIPFTDASRPGQGDELVSRIVSLDNIAPEDVTALLQQLKESTGAGSVVRYESANILLLTGKAAVVNQLVDIIKRVESADDRSIARVRLAYASAPEVARLMDQLINGAGKTAKSATPKVQVVADERTNEVLISGREDMRQRAIAMAHQLDQPSNSNSGNTQVYYLKYAKAKQLQEVLTGMSTSSQDGEKATGGVTAVSMMKDISIKADEQTNSLIITAPPDVLKELEQVIQKLDIRRAQVLIEAVIIEVQDADALNFGVQWMNKYGGGTNFTATGVPVTSLIGKENGISEALSGVNGLATGFYHGNWAALLTALSTNNNNDILATPSIVTLDNTEAEFNVGQEVPVLTGSQTTSGDNVYNTVDRKNVGIMLKVTPQINQGDSVLLDVKQEVSSVADVAPTGTSDLGATFNTRTVNNAVLVNSGETVVVGGLLDKTNSTVESKVPWLGDIPWLGNLFKYKSTKSEKRNLMLFIRPTIIRATGEYNQQSIRKFNEFSDGSTQKKDMQSMKQQLSEQLNHNDKGQALTDIQRDISAFNQSMSLVR